LKLKGAHVTFLTRDGNDNVRDHDGKSVRRTFGLVKETLDGSASGPILSGCRLPVRIGLGAHALFDQRAQVEVPHDLLMMSRLSNDAAKSRSQGHNPTGPGRRVVHRPISFP
jgi:hypothetical protein